MRIHKRKTWRTKTAKQEKGAILKQWQFVTAGRRSFAVYLGNRSTSQKEIEIIKILREAEIPFFKEISFDLKRRYDFYIPDIDLVIEYDGWRHFDTDESVRKDIEKEEVLKRMGIKLLRYNKNHNLDRQLGTDLLKFMPRS